MSGSVLGSGSFQTCADSCVSISLTCLQPWSAIILRGMWRWEAKQIVNRNTVSYTPEYTLPSTGGVHKAPAAGTDRTGLWDTETCSAWSLTLCGHRQIASLCFFIFLFTYKMRCLCFNCGKLGLRACPESLGTAPHRACKISFTPAWGSTSASRNSNAPCTSHALGSAWMEDLEFRLHPGFSFILLTYMKLYSMLVDMMDDISKEQEVQ